MKNSKWRTLLFFREFKAVSTDNDITFAAQLSFDRIQMIEELAKYWEGKRVRKVFSSLSLSCFKAQLV